MGWQKAGQFVEETSTWNSTGCVCVVRGESHCLLSPKNSFYYEWNFHKLYSSFTMYNTIYTYCFENTELKLLKYKQISTEYFFLCTNKLEFKPNWLSKSKCTTNMLEMNPQIFSIISWIDFFLNPVNPFVMKQNSFTYCTYRKIPE